MNDAVEVRNGAAAESHSTIYDRTIDELWIAGETLDCEAFLALLAHDVVIRSPITQRIRFEGIEQATDLFTRIFKIISDIKMYEVVGRGTPTQVIFWRGKVADTYLEEANLIRLDAQGKITEMTVFMRAIPGLLQLTARIAPSLARRHGRLRSIFVSAMLRIISAVYRGGEPLVLSLAGAGVPVRPTT